MQYQTSIRCLYFLQYPPRMDKSAADCLCILQDQYRWWANCLFWHDFHKELFYVFADIFFAVFVISWIILVDKFTSCLLIFFITLSFSSCNKMSRVRLNNFNYILPFCLCNFACHFVVFDSFLHENLPLPRSARQAPISRICRRWRLLAVGRKG